MAVVTLALTHLDSAQKEQMMDDVQAVDVAVSQLLTFFSDVPLEGKAKVASFGFISGDNGVDYDEVEFIVTSRYKIAGDLWIDGSGFRINLSQHARFIREELGL